MAQPIQAPMPRTAMNTTDTGFATSHSELLPGLTRGAQMCGRWLQPRIRRISTSRLLDLMLFL